METTISRERLKEILQKKSDHPVALSGAVLERNGFECVWSDPGLNTWNYDDTHRIVISETMLSGKAKPIYTYNFVDDDFDFSGENREVGEWDDFIIQDENQLKELIQYINS